MKDLANPYSTTQRYQGQLDALDGQLAELRARDRWYSRARGGAFLVFLAPLAWAMVTWGPSPQLFFVVAILFAAFVVLVGVHERVRDGLMRCTIRRRLKQDQLDGFLRHWDDLSSPQVDVPPAFAGIARDLDLFGTASVYQWLCRAHTLAGRETVRDWLLQPAEPAEIQRRQAAVRRLADMEPLRDDVEFHGRCLIASDTGPPAFIAWAEGGPRFARRRLLMSIVRTLTVVMVLLPVVIWWQWIPADWILVVLAVVALNVLINALFVGGIHDLFNQISAGQNELWHYLGLLRLVEGLPPDEPKLAELRVALSSGATDFEASLRQLNRIMTLGSGRRSSLFGVPYMVAQILWFWDFHVVTFLERWQARYGHSVRHWFESVAELEALCSLAKIASDHPTWSFPHVAVDCDTICARQMGHPLLPTGRCQTNDVDVGPPATFLLVTGSNMSGKSTLLRALGVNVTLASCGAPVCAVSMSLPMVELATSMRITDSLAGGVSFFLAELKRLKEIVDRAVTLYQAAKANTPARHLFFLLDEILQGTNSAERHIAVTQVIGHLMQHQALGAVSTHDLTLAAAPEMQDSCQPIHFREHFELVDGKREMRFDYQLRPGVAPTSNALVLLQMVGLGVKE